MQKSEVREWIMKSHLDGKGKNVLTARLLAIKTGFKQRYCNLLLEEFQIEGLLQSCTRFVIDVVGSSRPTKIYWKR